MRVGEAVLSYVSTVKYVLKEEQDDQTEWSNMYEYLPTLKVHLSCWVCYELLQEPVSPPDCHHSVCKNCLGGRMKLKPVCSWCKDFGIFEPNVQLESLVRCYCQLCEYILSSSQSHQRFLNLKLGKNEANQIFSLLEKGKQHETSQPISEKSLEPGTIKEEIPINHNTDTKHSEQASDVKNKQPGRPVISSCDVVTTASENKPTVSNFPELSCKEAATCSSKKDFHSETFEPSSEKLGNNAQTSIDFKHAVKVTHRISSDTVKPTKVPIKLPSEILFPVNQQGKSSHNSVGFVPCTEPSNKSEKTVQPPLQKKVKRKSAAKVEKKGCGCGTAAASNPGKLTCYGQRCPCYSAHNPCLDCRCKGCRNPNKIVKIEHASEDTDNDVEITVV